MVIPTVDEIADGIGAVAHAKSYDRIVAGKRTLAYVNPKKDALELDFRAKDLEGAPARLVKGLTAKGDRALLRVDGKATIARQLLEFVAGQA
jgi:hypothetical protein